MTNRIKHAVAGNVMLLCLFFVFLWVSLTWHSRNLRDTLQSDTEGYYMYLPAIFIYGGVHHFPEQFTGFIHNERGESYTKYTYGVSLFYLPFFLIAHLYAHIGHFEVSGFSTPYCYAMIMCGLFWSFVGLYILKRLLARYFDPVTVWLTLLCIMLGTNFYHYATRDLGMSHIYSFTLFAAAISAADLYYRAPSKRKAMLLGLLVGWIVLIRPTNIVMVVFLLFFNVVSANDIRERIVFFRTHFRQLLFMAPPIIVIMIPQLLYWKEMTGHLIKYSYENEHFLYWDQPKIAAVLFDTQNGLLLYSPILLFLFPALFLRRKDPRTNFIGVTIVFVIITYIFASWWAWWFGGAFGHRCYVDYYPVLAFPLAVMMEQIIRLKNYFLKIPLLSVVVVFCYYGVAMATTFMSKEIWDGPRWRWNYEGWWEIVRQIF